MNATQAINKIVELLGLKFQKESFFKTKLIDGTTEVTNNLESDFGVGQTLYIVGEATLSPAPQGSHTTREGLVLTVDEESTIVKIEEEVKEAEQEVVEDQVEVEQSAQFVEAKDAQGQTLESNTFDVGEEVYVVGADGEKTKAPNGEHQVVLKDSEGNDVKIRIQTEDGVIVQRENVEQMKEEEMAEFPWDECMLKMEKEGYSEDTAMKICGSIKAKNMSKEQMSSFSMETFAQLEQIKTGIQQLMEVMDSMNGKFKTEITSLKTDFESFKQSPERKPLEKKAQFKDSFEDFRTQFLKELRD